MGSHASRFPHARIAARYPAPGATFLTDVAVAPDGTVLVADSGTGRIFALQDGAMVVWSADPELKSANGLLPEAGRAIARIGAFVRRELGD